MNSPIAAIAAAVMIFLAPFASLHALTPNQISRGIPHQALFSVAFDGDRGYSVGAGGQILVSNDAGATWTPEESPTRLALLGVAVKGNVAIAVGQMGTIVVKAGDGDWELVEADTQERLFAVDLNAKGVAIAVGGFGTLLRSNDAGAQWSKAAPEWEGMFNDPTGMLGFFEPSMYDVRVTDDGVVTIVGEVSLVLRSEDGGETFTAVNAGGGSDEGIDPSLFAVEILPNGNGFAVGQEGFMLQTNDAGKTWRGMSVQTTSNLLGVSSSPAGEVVIAGMRDALFSVDNGQTWQRINGVDIAIGWYSGTAWPVGAVGPLLVGNAASILQIEK